MPLIYRPLDYDAFKKLAVQKTKGAKILFKNGCYNDSYYLAGYAIECALKACYCKSINAQTFPPAKNIYDKLYQHGLNKLLDVSGVKSQFDQEVSNNIKLQTNWNVTKDWTYESRYANSIKKTEAEALIKAITANRVGILTWIKKVW